jgi:FtsH-binding integral membrane protein
MEYAARQAELAAPQGFLQRVFGWMFAGLLVTAACAAAIGASDSLLTEITESPVLLIVLFGAQIGLVIWLTVGIQRMSPAMAAGVFFLYAALNGVVFAFVFELYTAQSIFTTFLITAGMFGAMAAWGYFTDLDLSRLGAVLFMALIGLILATIVNIFVANSALYWITTYAGVAIFAGLTAYDMQKLKQWGARDAGDGRMAVLGALALYLDFINLFLFLLRIFGQVRR